MMSSLRSAVVAATVILLIAGVSYAQAPNNQARKRKGDLRQPDRLKTGDLAPDFTLSSPDGRQTVTLSDFRNKRPVALVFGSYT